MLSIMRTCCDFTWNDHIRNNEKSLFKQLTSRVNALNKISSTMCFKTRKMMANGIIISPLIYLIQLWGGTSEYLLSFLQVIQNRAARTVTRLGWYTPVRTLMDQCGWLSVRQLVEYHSLVLLYKIVTEGKPVYLAGKLTQDFSYDTRFAAGHGIRQDQKIKHDVMLNSFIPRTTRTWILLPISVRMSANDKIFKQRLKPWIKTRFPVT